MAQEINYCVRCGAGLSRQWLFGQHRPACSQCGWVYFADPKVAAGVIVENESGILLVRRVNEPGRGMWSFPAGFVDAGEDPAVAAARECLEETGLQVSIQALIDVIAGREHERGADIIIVYAAVLVGGILVPGDDADQAAFFTRGSLPPLAFRATRLAIEHTQK